MTVKSKRSTLAVIVSSLYLLTVVVCLVIMLVTINDTAMSGIFLVIVTMPWSLILSWLQGALHFDSLIISTLSLVAGGFLNSFIFYKLISHITVNSKY